MAGHATGGHTRRDGPGTADGVRPPVGRGGPTTTLRRSVKVLKTLLTNVGRLVRLVVIVAVGVATLTATVAVAAPHLAEIAKAHRFEQSPITLQPLSERSYVYDREGQLIATFVDEENRVRVDIEDVPRTVLDSILTAEDSAFYSHHGVNARSIGRAFTANIESGGVAQGGSTITQQVVKNAIDEKDQDFARKVREAVLAVELEDTYTKDEILEYYINTVYFGSGAYGVQAAAETYFNKDVAELSYAEGALLGGIIRCPGSCDPLKSRSRALARRNTVLDALVTTGRLPRGEADLSKFAPVPGPGLPPAGPPTTTSSRRSRSSCSTTSGWGPRPRPASTASTAAACGSTPPSTRPSTSQALESRNDTLPGNDGDATFSLPDAPNGATRFGTAAMAGVEPETGAVRFLVGGPGFDRYQYDLALGDERADHDGGHPHQRLQQAVIEVLDRDQSPPSAAREQVIPVCYGGEYGPDLAEVAEHAGIDIRCVIARHTEAQYRVAMLGFAPGFPYLLGLDPALAMPRRRDPRQRVPAGSVAIGGEQTGIYPQQLPGGWQLIGRTPRRLFDIRADPPSLLAAGDRVRFEAIDEERFRQLDAESSR